MANEQQLINAIRKADAAGDGDAVRALGAELLRIRGQQQKPETVSDYAGSAVYGASPYATAALLGGAAGAPFAGVGAPIGAAGGVAALGIGDIATAGYNALASAIGAKQIPLPSQQISERLANIGVGKRPETAGQRITSALSAGITGGGIQPAALKTLTPLAAGQTSSRVLTELAKNPVMQAVAGGSAATAGQTATEAGANPWLSALAAMGGGIVGGKFAMKKPQIPTTQDIRTAAGNSYQQAEQAGVKFTPTGIENMASDINSTLAKESFHPKLHPRINVAIDEVNQLAEDARQGGIVSLPRLELTRRLINTASKSLDPDERRLGYMMRNKLDEFVTNAQIGKDILAGDQGGIEALKNARKLYSQASKSDTIEELINKASMAEGSFATNLKSQFRRLANREASMRFFTKPEQDAIRQIAKGTMTDNTLSFLASFAPGKDLRSWVSTGMQGAAAAAAGNPWMAALSIGAGAGAKGARNLISKKAATSLSQQVRGVQPSRIPYSLIAPAAGQQAIVWPYKIPQGK